MVVQVTPDLEYGTLRKMKDGYWWVLGDGKTINIHLDRWLRGKENFHVDHDASLILEVNEKVFDFFRNERKSWDEGKFRYTFSNNDVEAILATQVPQISITDMLS